MNDNGWDQRRLSRRTFLMGLGAGVGSFTAASLLGCGSSSPQSSTAKDTTAGTPTPRRGGIIRMAYVNNPTNLDPFTTRLAPDKHWQYAIFDNLVGMDPKFQPIPELAESWNIIDDLTIDFRLRKGVKFHDGTDFNASVVKFNIERHIDPNTGSYARGSLLAVDSVEVIDDYTARLHLNSISASLFSALAEKGGMMSSPTAVQKWGKDYARHPVGTGPFQFVEWVQDSHVDLKRFDGYWNQPLPYLDGIHYEIIPDPTVQVTNLLTGAIDLILPGAKDVAQLKVSPGIIYMESMGIGYGAFNFNLALEPFVGLNKGMYVRRAMTWSVDREAIVNGIYFGQGKVGYSPLTDTMWAHDPNLVHPVLDLDKAKGFLAQAGYPNGLKFQALANPGETSTPEAEMIQAQWAKIGIQIEIVMRDPATASTEYRDQKYPCFFQGFSGRADPDQTVAEEFHTKGGFNRAGFNPNYKTENPELDSLIEQARSTYDIEKRKKLYAKVEDIIVNNAHGIFWRQNAIQLAIRNNVQNMVQYGDGIMRFKEVWLKD